MYTAEGGRRMEGAEDIFERAKVFHIPSHHTVFFLTSPLLTKRKEKKKVTSLM